MTIPADAVMRRHHLESALHHVLMAVTYTEGLVSTPGVDVSQLYADRANLRYMADQITDMLGEMTEGEPW